MLNCQPYRKSSLMHGSNAHHSGVRHARTENSDSATVSMHCRSLEHCSSCVRSHKARFALNTESLGMYMRSCAAQFVRLRTQDISDALKLSPCLLNTCSHVTHMLLSAQAKPRRATQAPQRRTTLPHSVTRTCSNLEVTPAAHLRKVRKCQIIDALCFVSTQA